MGFKNRLVEILVGFCAGVVDAIPGISGVSVLLIADLYEDMLNDLTKLSELRLVGIKRLFIRNNDPSVSKRSKWSTICVAFGAVFGVILSVLTIDLLLDSYKNAVFGLFIGIIPVSGYLVLRRDLQSYYNTDLLLIAVGAMLSGSVSILADNLYPSLSLMLLLGMIVSVAMLLPSL